MPRACESHYGSRRRRESTTRSEQPEVKRAPKASGSEAKSPKVGQRPFDSGPPLTAREIQLAPVIWAKLSGYSWWPARAATPEEVKGVKKPHGKDMICTYFLGDNNIGFVKLSNVLRFTHENCEQYGSRITTKSFKDGVTAAMALLRENDKWEKECQAKAEKAEEAVNGNAIDVTGPDPGAPIDVDGTGTTPVSDDGACEMCGDNNEAKGDILLCDSCDAEYHLACCTPPLKACPEGEWFCLTCRVNRGEPVSVLFNEERAKKEATAQQHQWLGKPPLPNKAGTKRSATDTPSPKKAQHKKVKPNGSSSSSTSASAAGGAVSDGNTNTSSGNTAGNTRGGVGDSGAGGGVISAGTGLVNSGASRLVADKPGTASPVVANRPSAVATAAPAAPASIGTNSHTGGNANSNHATTAASPASVASTPPPRGVSDSSPGTSCVAPSSSVTEQQQRTPAESGTTAGSGSNGSGGIAASHNVPRRGRPPGSTAVNSNRLSSRGGRPGRPPSKHHLRQGRPPNKPTTVVANSTSTAAATASSVYPRSNGSGGSKDNGGGKVGGRGGGTNSTSGGRSNENHSYQQQQHVLVRGKRPRGDADGGVTGGGGRGWGGSAASSGSGNVRHGRTPPPVPASYVNASQAFSRLGIPVSLPGGGRAAVQQQLHLQQTVQQLQATRHLHYQRGAFGGVLGTTAAAAAAVAAMQGGRRSPSAVADPAEMPQCFMCQEDVTQWGENAGNGEALRCAYKGCGRVFHVTCVAHILQDMAVHTPDGSGAVSGKWTCLLHRCARCGTDGSAGGEIAAPAAGRKGGGNPGEGSAGGSRLWQCTWCSVAFCMKHLPSQLSTAGRKARVADANQCLHCRSPSPRVKLAILLEGMCSRLANHHLAIPFLRPFLPGIASAKRSSPSGVADADREAGGDEGVKREGVGGCSPSSANFSAAARGRDSGERLKAPAADQGVGNAERRTLGVDPAGHMPTGGRSSTAGSMGPAALTSRDEGVAKEAVRNGSSKAISGPMSPLASSSPGGVRGAGKRGRRGKSTGAPCASVEVPACAPAKTNNNRNSPICFGAVTVPREVDDIMGLLDKTRALGYSRSVELMADVRMLQGKCKQAVARWGGDPETGGGFGGGAGRVVVKAMDTLAAIMESMLARSREELTNVETDIAKKSEDEHRRLTERGVGDGTAGDSFPWRAECLPPPLRPSTATANGSSYSSGAGEHRSRLPPLRLTRRWSLAKWAEYLQNPPMLRRSTGQTEPGETITVDGKEVLGTLQMRRDMAEGMLSPAFPADPDDSEVSDGCYMSDFYSDDDLDEADSGRDGTDELGPVVPPWSELETAVQALMGMEGVDRREDTWDVTESARLVQIESVLEEQRRLMRRMIKHNGNLRALWRRYAASPLEDRGGQGAEGVVTLGETSVLKEFKISNDLLRKRVEDLEEQLRIQTERTEGAFPAERPGRAPGGPDNGRAATSAVNVAPPAQKTAAPAPFPGSSVTYPGVTVNHARENGLIATKNVQVTATAKVSSPAPASSAEVRSAPSAASDAGPGLASCSASASADSTSADEREEGPLVDVVGCSPDFTTEPTAMDSIAAPPVTSSYISAMRSGSATSESVPAGVSAAGLRAAGGCAVNERIETMAVAREQFLSPTHNASATRGLPISVACASDRSLPEKMTVDSGDSLGGRVEVEGLGSIGVSDAVRTDVGGVIEANDVGDDDGDGVDPIDDDGEAVTVEGSGGMDVEENGTADNDDDDAGVLL